MEPSPPHVRAGKKRRRTPSISRVPYCAVAMVWQQLSAGAAAAAPSGIMFGRTSRQLYGKSRRCWSGHRHANGDAFHGTAFATLVSPATSPTCPSRAQMHHVEPWPRPNCRAPSTSPRMDVNIQHTHRLHSTATPLQRGDADLDEEEWHTLCKEMEETLILPTISVPARHVHGLLSNKDSPLQPLLATRMAELEGVHPHVKVVRDCGRSEAVEGAEGGEDAKPVRRKRILLDSHLATSSKGNDTNSLDRGAVGPLHELTQQLPGVPEEILKHLVNDFEAVPGAPEHIHISYHNQPVSRILSKLLPPEAQPPPSSYEQIGHVAHLNLKQSHLPYKYLIGRVLLDRLPLRTVVNKLGEVGGPYRTYQMELLAGEDDYDVSVTEHGASLHFDLRKVYWCTRLEGERTHMIENDFKPNQLVADAFCGVGALCIRAALARGCRILANDLNPDAVEYCKDSARRNGIDANGDSFQVSCGDASQFIMNLGIDPSSENSASDGDGGATTSTPLPDHLILNFPLASPSFLNALRWWPSGAGGVESPPRVHVYTFARGDDDRTAAEAAVDLVADGLLPEGGYVEPSKFRGAYLDELGCHVQAREVRDAAPGKLVICVSFSVTRLLLRRMQGDYGLD